MKDTGKEILSHTWFINKIVLLADECRRHCLEGQEFGSKVGINHTKKSKIKKLGKDTIMLHMLMAKQSYFV